MYYFTFFVSPCLLDVTVSINGSKFDVTYLCTALLILAFVRSLGSSSTKRHSAKVVKLSILFLLLNVSAFGQTEKEKCRGVEFVISTLHEHFDTSNHIEAVISVLPIGGSEDDAILLQKGKVVTKEIRVVFRKFGTYSIAFYQVLQGKMKILNYQFKYFVNYPDGVKEIKETDVSKVVLVERTPIN